MKNKHQFLYEELSSQLIGISYSIYNELGYGHPEKVYQKAFEVELRKNKIDYSREKYHKILYDGEVVGKYYLDFLIDKKIALELKVRRELYESDIQQLISYLKATRLKVGILIVFTKTKPLIKRLVN